MAFSPGRLTVVLWDALDLSAYFNKYSSKRSAVLPPTTTFGATAVRRQVVALLDGTANLTGLWDGAVAAVDATLSAALGAASGSVVTVGKAGLALGARVDLLSAREASYDVDSAVESTVNTAAEVQADGGIERGFSLHALTAETATGNGASLDNLAATANGGVAHLNCTAVAGTNPTNTVKVQHSVDDAVWLDLVTFTQLTAVGQERIEVAAGTSVARWLRAIRTIGGTGGPSFTFATAFARRA